MRFETHPALVIALVVSSLSFTAAPAYAQPSGGPYGPIDQTYEIPKAAHVYYVAPDGRADASGGTLAQPMHLPRRQRQILWRPPCPAIPAFAPLRSSSSSW
jgi:hypothetical protein